MGGLVLKPMSVDSNSLIKGHRYVIMFEIKGQSSNNAMDVNWNNNVGWNGGGLTPQPSNVVINRVVDTNFKTDDWSTFSYAWTINDDVYKVCTSSYAGFVQGNTYLSYDGFKFGFGYTSTGSLGTDLYLKNFRMYDITNSIKNTIIQKVGIANPSNFVEDVQTLSLYKDQEIVANEIIEY